MRTTTAPELATLAASTKRITVRFKVANGSGTMIDITSWLESYSIDHDVDQPVGGATFSFSRAHGATQSLAPLREDSVLNVDDTAAYAPLLDLNRIVTFEVATTNLGAVVLSTDYKLLFKGTIDVVNFEKSPISIECRDGGALLVDRWIETPEFYGTTPVGTPIQDVMQEINDDIFGVGAFPLYFDPADPLFNIIKYQQQIMSVMDAQQDLMQLRALDIRSKWDDGTSMFRVTVWEPDRTKTIPDHTFGPSHYIAITRLSLDLTNIRTVVTVTYRDGPNLGNRASVTVSDAGAITKYGRRPLIIQEPDISPIDSSVEATTMANGALSDLKEPKAEQEVELPFFWPVEVGDLYRYSPNGVHYDVDQDLAVVEIRHSGSRNTHRTTLKVRGGVCGQYLTWFGRGGSGGPGSGGSQAYPPRPFIRPLNTETDATEWDLEFDAAYGSGGGGTNLTYTVKSKNSIGGEVTVSSGNASAFPLTLSINREFDFDALVTFTVTDAATGMFDDAVITVPMRGEFVTPTGTVEPGSLEPGNLPGGINDSIGRPVNDAFFISTHDADVIADGTVQRTIPLTVVSINNDVTVRKLKGSGSTPTLSDEQAYWNGTNTIVGTDTAGRVTLEKTSVSATTAQGNQFKVTFAVAYPSIPFVIISADQIGIGFKIGDVQTTHFWVSRETSSERTGTGTDTITVAYGVIG